MAVVDVGSNGYLNKISLDGNDLFTYTNNNLIGKFVEYIKEYYNVNEFSNIEIGVKIFPFDANKDRIYYLFES